MVLPDFMVLIMGFMMINLTGAREEDALKKQNVFMSSMQNLMLF